MSYGNHDLCRFYELCKPQKYLDFMSYVNHGSKKVVSLKFC